MARKPSYVIGRNAEYHIIRRLKALGFHYIVRSAGSHGAIDILAADEKGERLAIQVKKSKGLSIEERSNFVAWARVFGAKPFLARKRGSRWVLEEAHDGPSGSHSSSL